MDADAFVWVYLEHAADEVCGEGIDGVRDEVIALWMQEGVRYILRYSRVTVSSSKGSDPTSKAYRMTPQLQISTEVPSYFLSPTISGAA